MASAREKSRRYAPGVTMVELLVIIVIIALVSDVFTMVFKAVVVETPRAHRIVQEHEAVCTMLERLRKDVESARSLPASIAGQDYDGRQFLYAAGDMQLLIELPSGVVAYRQDGGKVKRTEIGRPGCQESIWDVPDAVILWRLWYADAASKAKRRACGVETAGSIEFNRDGRHEVHMANSQVFFLKPHDRSGGD
ncbi:MAG: type II secretion system protein [Phycisphaerae bacterium]